MVGLDHCGDYAIKISIADKRYTSRSIKIQDSKLAVGSRDLFRWPIGGSITAAVIILGLICAFTFMF